MRLDALDCWNAFSGILSAVKPIRNRVMVSAEIIYQKAQKLSTFRLQELADYLDFLLSRDALVAKKNTTLFPPTKIKYSHEQPIYQGKPLTIEEMDNAIDYEAGVRK